MIKPAPLPSKASKHGETSTMLGALPISALSTLSLSLSPPFSGGAREHDMAYLTQITALCQTSHFLLDMQAAFMRQTDPHRRTHKAGARKHSKNLGGLSHSKHQRNK